MFKNKIRIHLAGVIFGFIIGCLLIYAIKYINTYAEYEYKLTPIENETYAIYYSAHSNVPANNYGVITFSSNGTLYTFKGDVHISFSNDNFYVKVKQYTHMVNNDEIWIYIPQNSLSYRESVNIGR